MKLVSKLPFLRIKLVDKIPSRFGVPRVGVYQTLFRTIWLRRGHWLNVSITFIHEFGHWAIHLFHRTDELQQDYEWFWEKFIDPTLAALGKFVRLLIRC